MESDQPARASSVITSALQAISPLRYLGPGLLILGVGLLGRHLLFSEQTRLAGVGLLFLAALLAILLLPSLPGTTSPIRSGARMTLSVDRALVLRMAGIASAILLCAASLFAWFSDPGAVFGLQGVLWLGSIGLLVISCTRWTSSSATREEAWSRNEKLLISGLIALALCTYLLNLDSIPWRFHYDEVLAYKETMRFFKGPPISLFTTTWSGTGLPSLWFVFPAALMHIVGTGLAGVRSGVALAGAFTMIPVYGLARLLAGRTAAALAAFAWAVSPVAIQYSRISIINMTTGLAWAVCFLFLVKGLRSRSPAHFMWSGLAAGLSMYTYYGTRLLPYLLAAFVLYLLVFHSRALKVLLPHFGLLGASFFVGFGPLLAYFMNHPDVWAGRGLSELSVPAVLPTTPAMVADYWNALAPLIEKNFLGLSVTISRDGCYWGTFFSPVWAVLFLVGVGLLVRRWRNPEAALLLIWLGGVLFVGGILVGKNFIPDYAHWTPAFPAFFVALAVPPALWLQSLASAPHRMYMCAVALVAAGALLQAASEGYWYLNVYPKQVPTSFEDSQGRLLSSLTSHDRVLFIGNSWQPFYSAIGEMMAPNIPASDLLNPARELPIQTDPGHDLTFVFNNDETQYLPLVESYYPGGQVTPIDGPVGKPLTYRVTSEQVLSRYGVLLSISSGADTTWSGKVQKVGDLPSGITTSYPVTATWSGLLLVTRAAERATLDNWTGTELWVEGRQVTQDTTPTLDEGWVPFTVQARLDGPQPPRLRTSYGAVPPAEVPSGRLWPQPPGQGLAVTISRNGSALSERIDPYAGSSIWGTTSFTLGGVLPMPRSRDPQFLPIAPDDATQVTWQGEIYTEGGTYIFNLRSDGTARVKLDGQTLFDLHNPNPGYPPKGGDPGTDTRQLLPVGWHPIVITLSPTGDANGLELSWTRPDGTREIIPPSRFRYTAP